MWFLLRTLRKIFTSRNQPTNTEFKLKSKYFKEKIIAQIAKTGQFKEKYATQVFLKRINSACALMVQKRPKLVDLQ